MLLITKACIGSEAVEVVNGIMLRLNLKDYVN